MDGIAVPSVESELSIGRKDSSPRMERVLSSLPKDTPLCGEAEGSRVREEQLRCVDKEAF